MTSLVTSVDDEWRHGGHHYRQWAWRHEGGDWTSIAQVTGAFTSFLMQIRNIHFYTAFFGVLQLFVDSLELFYPARVVTSANDIRDTYRYTADSVSIAQLPNLCVHYM